MTENETKSENASETVSPQRPDAVKTSTVKSKSIDKETTNQAIENQKEYGGREGLSPTRYGDWERNGRCVDF